MPKLIFFITVSWWKPTSQVCSQGEYLSRYYLELLRIWILPLRDILSEKRAILQEPFKKTFLNDNLQNLQTQLVGNDYVTKKWFGTTICKQFVGRKNLHVQKIFRTTTTIFWDNYLQNLKQMIPSDNFQKVVWELAAFAKEWSTATTCKCCMEQLFVKRYPDERDLSKR